MAEPSPREVEQEPLENAWWAQERRASPLKVFFFQWPMLLAAWGYLVWLAVRLPGLLSRAPDDSVSIDGEWLTTLLPPMLVMVVVVFAYISWLAWSFFQHN